MGISSDDIVRIATEEGVPVHYALAMLKQENSRADQVSSAGAVGQAQVLPATFKAMMPNGDINDPKDNIRAGIKYLKEGLDKSGGDISKAAAYYYGGPNWQKKVENAPGRKYGGTGPNDGISIEDYAKSTVKHAGNYGGAMTVEEFAASSFPDSEGVSVSPGDRVTPGIVPDTSSTIGSLSNEADRKLKDIQSANASLSDRIKANAAKQAATIRQEGELNATIALDKFQQESAKAGEASAELSRLGINLSDINSVVAQSSIQIKEDYLKAQELRRAINEKRSVGMFDSPLEYIINQFTLPTEIKQHNDIIRGIESQKNFLDGASATAKNLEQANAAKFTTVSMAGAKAGADLMRAQAEERAVAAEDKALSIDYDRQVRELTIINQRIANKRAVEESEDRSDVRKSIQQKKDEEKERVDNDNSAVKTAALVLGMDIPDRKTLDKKPKDEKAAVEYVMANGGGIGRDPLEAQQVLARGDYRKMPAVIAYQKNTLDTIRKQAEELVSKRPEMATASVAQKKEAVSQQMINLVNQASLDPNHSVKPTFSGVVNNPYNIPAVATMEKLPEVGGLRITKILQDYKKEFSGKNPDDNLVVELAYANIGPGKAYPDMVTAARDVANYYREGVKYNNLTMKFENFGMPAQESYRVGRLDMTRAETITKYFLDKQKEEFLNKSVVGGRIMGAN